MATPTTFTHASSSSSLGNSRRYLFDTQRRDTGTSLSEPVFSFPTQPISAKSGTQLVFDLLHSDIPYGFDQINDRNNAVQIIITYLGTPVTFNRALINGSYDYTDFSSMLTTIINDCIDIIVGEPPPSAVDFKADFIRFSNLFYMLLITTLDLHVTLVIGNNVYLRILLGLETDRITAIPDVVVMGTLKANMNPINTLCIRSRILTTEQVQMPVQDNGYRTSNVLWALPLLVNSSFNNITTNVNHPAPIVLTSSFVDKFDFYITDDLFDIPLNMLTTFKLYIDVSEQPTPGYVNPDEMKRNQQVASQRGMETQLNKMDTGIDSIFSQIKRRRLDIENNHQFEEAQEITGDPQPSDSVAE